MHMLKYVDDLSIWSKKRFWLLTLCCVFPGAQMAEVRLDFTVELSQEISREPLSTYNPEQVLYKELEQRAV